MATLPDLSKVSLSHALAAYDPVKAHEYYLRTRELKGRTPGAAPQANPKLAARQAAAAAAKKAQASRAARIAAHQKAMEQEVIHLEARLAQLREILKKLVAQAKGRAGVEPTKTVAAPAKKAAAKKASHQTAAEKAKAHAAYEKNKKKQAAQTPDQEVKQAQEKIKKVKIQIEKMRMDLQAAQQKTAHAAHPNKQSGSNVPAVKQTVPIKK